MGIISLFLPLAFSPLQAATLNWTGSVSNDWFNAANWSPAQVPSAADNAVIDRNATVTAGGGTSISFASLVLGDAAGNFSPTLRLSAAENTSGAITIHRGAKLQQDTNQQIIFGSLTVMPGGLVTHTANSTARSFLINLSVTGDFDLQAGATIATSGLGYAGGAGYQAAGSGPGGGAGNDSSSGSGGGHGGTGGLGRNAVLPGGAANDSVTNPVDLGSGGGGGYPGAGGSGGGAVLLNVSGTLLLNGLISVNGVSGPPAGAHGSGGGAGGTVNLAAGVLTGAGVVQANGGDGGGAGGQGGGGGGGGRISITVASSDTSSLNLQTGGGNGGNANGLRGGAGTITLRTPGGTDYSLSIGDLSQAAQAGTPVGGASPAFSTVTLNNSIVTFDPTGLVNINSLVIAGQATLTANNIVLGPGGLQIKQGGLLQLAANALSGGPLLVEGGGVFKQMNTASLAFTSVNVAPGGVLTHAANGAARASVLNLSVSGDFTLQAGASITVAGLGYGGGSGYQISGSGPGGGPGNASSSGNGGGHGGTGGLGRGATLPGGAGYDSITNPTDLGSGGGGGYASVLGGSGGGAVVLNVAGTLFLDGSISANGVTGPPAGVHGSGGGAGGTVNLTAGALSGAGVIQANGGDGSGAGGQGGGGGGGGRIAITVASNDSSDLVLAADAGAGGNADGKTGGAGVVAYKRPGAAAYDLDIGGVAVTALGATPITAAPAFGAVSVTNAGIIGSTMTFASFAVSGAVSATAAKIVLAAAAPFEVRGGASLSFNAQSVTGGALTVRENAVFRQMNAAQLNFGSVLVETGGLITHAANSTARSFVVNLGAAGDFNLQAGATISASGLGYSGGSGYQVSGAGPGGGPGNASSSGSGGGHGGMGGPGSGAGTEGGATNDSAVNPMDPGSGGGGAYPSVPGGPGGGVVLLNIGGGLSLNGLIAVDGAAGGGAIHGGGGGSGGTVNIRAAAISGLGTIKANGGAGGGFTGQGGGGGGGGRIAVTAAGTPASPVALNVNGGAAGLANGGPGARGTVIYNGVLSDGTTNSAAVLAFSQMQEGVAVTKVLGETLSAQLLDFAGATSTGVPAGSFTLAELRLVMIKTGPFTNKGFFRGRWTLGIPGGSPLTGEWEGMAFFPAGNSQRLSLKGVLKGQIQGVLDGSLTESTPGSGTFDRLSANCRLVQAANTMGSSTIYISGAGVVRETMQYPGTVLNYLQATQAGEVGGYYSTPLDVAFSLVRVDNPGNPYQGEGFFSASYDSPLGSGSGWAYAAVSGGSARLAGVFDEALRGFMEGTLAVDSPRALFLTLQNLDAGLPLQADINVRLSLPGNTPVGGLATVIVELRNDGYAVADGVTVVAVAPEKSTVLTATGDYRSYNVTHWRGTEYAPKPFIRWDFASVPARSSQTMSYQVRLPAGQAPTYQSGVGVETITKAWADTIFANYHLGETP